MVYFGVAVRNTDPVCGNNVWVSLTDDLFDDLAQLVGGIIEFRIITVIARVRVEFETGVNSGLF